MNLRVITATVICILALQGCTLLFGTGPTAKVGVAPGLRITDLSTNERLVIDTVEQGDLSILVPNSQRHALKIENDTATSYVFMEPRWDPLSLLNLLSPGGIGIAIGQLTRSDYEYDEKYIIGPRRYGVPPSQQPQIEDSLRKRVTPLRPTSVINDRMYGIVGAWVTFGFEGPTTQAVIGPPWGGYGFGLQIVPWVKVLHERGYLGYIETGNLYDTDGSWQSFGVHLQEPVYGLFASWKYGSMSVAGYSYLNDEWPRPTYNADLTFYTLSFGIYGQWGRIEYRHRRNTSWTRSPMVDDLSGSYNGIHYTIHLLL